MSTMTEPMTSAAPKWSRDASTGTYAYGDYTVEPEGRGWGLYRLGSRFGAADTLARAKAAVERSASA